MNAGSMDEGRSRRCFLKISFPRSLAIARSTAKFPPTPGPPPTTSVPINASPWARRWENSDVQQHIVFMKNLTKSLVESGELVSTEGLALPDQARIVRAGKNGAPITDGVFPESKEFLAGYWIVDVDTPERAYQIAAQASAAPGPGGTPLNMPIEVRQVMSGPPEEFL